MRSTATRWTLLALVAALGACSAPRTDSAAGGIGRDSAGILIVENAGPPRDTVTLTLERVLSLGDASSQDTVEHFAYIGGVLRLVNGTIVVASGADTRWFDAGGKYVKTGTRRGSGPGEIDGTRSLALTRLSGDSVAVTEMRGGQFKHVVLSPSGDFVRDERVDGAKMSSLGRWGECSVNVLPDLSITRCEGNAGEGERGPDPGPGLLRERRRLARVPATLDARYDLGYDIGLEQFGLNVGRRWHHFVIHPFHARSHVAAGGAPMRIAIVTNPGYSIEIWSAQGKLERIIRRLDGRRAPTDAERRWAREQLAARERRYNPELVDRVLAGVPTPDSLPAAQGLLVSSNGEIYVSRFSLDSALYDVFAADGAYVRLLRLPPRFGLTQVDGDYLVGVRRDEDDVPLVEVYRIVRNR